MRYTDGAATHRKAGVSLVVAADELAGGRLTAQDRALLNRNYNEFQKRWGKLVGKVSLSGNGR